MLSSLPPKVRAFIAVRVGDEVEAALAAFIDEKREPQDGIVWARRGKLHVTLKFLGAAVDSQLLSPLAAALARLASTTPPLLVSTRGIGAFPDQRRPRVLWVGLESEVLPNLAARVEEIAVSSGFERSPHRWVPHLTIGRVRDPRKTRRIQGLLNDTRDCNFGESLVREVTLYRSLLSSDGSIHQRLASFPLLPEARDG